MSVSFKIKVHNKSKTSKAQVSRILKKLKTVESHAIDVELPEYTYITISVPNCSNIIDVVYAIMKEGVYVDFYGIIGSEQSIELSDESNRIAHHLFRDQLSALESITIRALHELGAVKAQLISAHIKISELQDMSGIDICNVVAEICQEIGREDIIERHIDELTVQ